MYKKIFFILLSINISAKDITIEFIDSIPYSVSKDYYIWRYLSQDISAENASKAFDQTKRMNNKILYRYAKKSNDKFLKHDIKCKRMSAKNIMKINDVDCTVLGLTTRKALHLSSSNLIKIVHRVKDIYPRKSSIYHILASSLPYDKILLNKDETLFFDIFNRVSKKYREKKLNYKLPKKYLNRLITHSSFNLSIKIITTNPKLKKLQESILNIDSSKLSHHSNFYLALNALRHNSNSLAIKYLDIAQKKAWLQFDIDKVIFWKYLISKDYEYLKQLNESYNINIYTLYANNKLKTKPKNIISNIKVKQIQTKFNILNPFEWEKVLNESKNLDYTKLQEFEDLFSSIETKPHLARMYEKFSKYKNHYYLMPYEEYLKNSTVHKKALIYALARQESRFIPSSISTSYALGVMQFMPFLSQSIAKEKKQKLNDLDDMLYPQKSVEFAIHHLKFLEYRLKHVLFVAYAYNGGIGFTRRLLKNNIFTTKNKYEPFISMELISNNESRKYGKKVFANYIIYRELLGSPVDFNKQIQKIKSPYL